MSANQIDPDRRLWQYDGIGHKVYKDNYNVPYEGIDLEKLLVILMEECGELVQRCSKVLRHGAGNKQMQDIHEEAADVKCLMDILIAEDFLDEQELDRLIELKRLRLIKKGYLSK